MATNVLINQENHIDEAANRQTSQGLAAGSPTFGRTWIDIVVLAVLCAAIRLPWLFIIPISKAPDEGAHYWVLKFVWQAHRLPAIADVMADPHAAYYGALATLSYFPHLVCAHLLPWFDPALAFRFGSIVASIVAVIAAYGIGKELFTKSRIVSYAVPLFMVFHPQLVFVGAYTNNDSTSVAVSSWLLYLCVRMIKFGVTPVHAVGLGLLCGLQATCKPTGFSLFPIAALSVLLSLSINQQSKLVVARRVGLAWLIAALVAAPLLIKNYILFEGDLLGTKTMLRAWLQAYGIAENMYKWPLIDNANWRFLLFVTFWGAFGNMDSLLPGRFYKWFSWMMGLASLGYVLAIARGVRTDLSTLFKQHRIELACFAVMAISLAVSFALTMISSAFLNSAGPAQGRYLFPSEAAIATLVMGGLALAGGRYRGALIGAALLLLASATVYGWLMLFPEYGFSLNIFR